MKNVFFFHPSQCPNSLQIKKTHGKAQGTSKDGAAVLFDVHTGLIIGFGSHHRYCSFCQHHAKDVGGIPQHKCFADWKGKSPQVWFLILFDLFGASQVY